MERVEYMTCTICGAHCAAKVSIDDSGRITKWEQDKESGFPYLPCATYKGRTGTPELNMSNERLKYPLKRAGARGEGKWQRISWDEAFDTVATGLNEIKEKYGPQALAAGVGEPRGFEFPWIQRFCSVYGTPNIYTPHTLCGAPRFSAASSTWGAGQGVQTREGSSLIPPKLLLQFGASGKNTGQSREEVRKKTRNGAKLVIIDPRRVDPMTKWADMWLQICPGTDGCFVFGMLKVIIEEKLYDKDFVDKWTVGFDKIEEEVKKFTLDDVERVTWIPKDKIQQVARWYAELHPSEIRSGYVFTQSARAFEASRLMYIMQTITTPENILGFGKRRIPPNFVKGGKLYLMDKFPRSVETHVGKQHRYALRAAYVPSPALVDAMMDGRLKGAFFMQCNPLTSWPNARRVYDGMMKLDFIVTADVFMAPTAAISDVVLPAATLHECDLVNVNTGNAAPRAIWKVLDPPGEAMSDVQIINNLANKMGIGEHFFKSDREVIDYVIAPSGVSWEELKKVRHLEVKEESVAEEGGFFTTPSGKAEIYSSRATEVYGCEPLPRWGNLLPIFNASAKYPLLFTSYMEPDFVLTRWRHLRALRKFKPFPEVQLHPDVAKQIGAEEGDWVGIETAWGKIIHKLVIDPELDPRVVMGGFGWFFPEDPSNANQWDKANINVILPDAPVEISSGSSECRGIPCRVYKASAQEVGGLEEKFAKWMAQGEIPKV